MRERDVRLVGGGGPRIAWLRHGVPPAYIFFSFALCCLSCWGRSRAPAPRSCSSLVADVQVPSLPPHPFSACPSLPSTVLHAPGGEMGTALPLLLSWCPLIVFVFAFFFARVCVCLLLDELMSPLFFLDLVCAMLLCRACLSVCLSVSGCCVLVLRIDVRGSLRPFCVFECYHLRGVRASSATVINSPSSQTNKQKEANTPTPPLPTARTQRNNTKERTGWSRPSVRRREKGVRRWRSLRSVCGRGGREKRGKMDTVAFPVWTACEGEHL